MAKKKSNTPKKSKNSTSPEDDPSSKKQKRKSVTRKRALTPSAKHSKAIPPGESDGSGGGPSIRSAMARRKRAP